MYFPKVYKQKFHVRTLRRNDALHEKTLLFYFALVNRITFAVTPL